MIPTECLSLSDVPVFGWFVLAFAVIVMGVWTWGCFTSTEL